MAYAGVIRHEISYRPTFAQLEVLLEQGEAIQAEAGAKSRLGRKETGETVPKAEK